MYTKNKYNYRIENAISKLKIQHDHALISTEVAEKLFIPEGKNTKPQVSTKDRTPKPTVFRQNRYN